MSTNIYAGNAGDDGDLVLRDRSGRTRIHLDSGHSSPWSDHVRVFLDGQRGFGRFGDGTRAGDLELTDGDGGTGVDLDGYFGEGTFTYLPGGSTSTADRKQVRVDAWDPSIELRRGWDTVLSLDAYGTPNVDIGSRSSGGRGGRLWLRDTDGRTRVWLDGGTGVVPYLGNAARARIILDGGQGSLTLGGGVWPAASDAPATGRDGTVRLRNAAGQTTTVLDGGDSSLVLTAPNGSKHRLTVANDGSLSTTPA